MREGRDAKFQNWLGVRPCEGAKRPRGGGGCPPSHGRELFHFGVRNCAIWCIPIIQFYLHNSYGYVREDGPERHHLEKKNCQNFGQG